jgi:MtfA peptidase
MPPFSQRMQRWLPRAWRHLPPWPKSLWPDTLRGLPFLTALSDAEQGQLRRLCGHFLLEKEFHGAHGLAVTDHMALSVATQACLPLLHIHPPSGKTGSTGLDALDWYDDFVGIVMQPGAAVARRVRTDPVGVVHQYEEVLAGEAMDRGPVMLSWDDVSRAPQWAQDGGNVVIHEFVHKIDMRGMHSSEHPDGAPALLHGLWGCSSALAARAHWQRTMSEVYQQFREDVALAERFGGEPPWLDRYAAQDPAEFFAVTSEAYFVQRARFADAFPALLALYDGFFRARA